MLPSASKVAGTHLRDTSLQWLSDAIPGGRRGVDKETADKKNCSTILQCVGPPKPQPPKSPCDQEKNKLFCKLLLNTPIIGPANIMQQNPVTAHRATTW